MVNIYLLIKALGLLETTAAVTITSAISIFIYNYQQDYRMKNKHKRPIIQRIKQFSDGERKLEDFDQNE